MSKRGQAKEREQTMDAVRTRAGGRWALTLALLVAAALLALAAGATPAQAQLEVTEFSGQVLDRDGAPETRAGAHPYSATTTIRFATKQEGLATIPVESVKDLEVDLPAGFVGDPRATPTRCTSEQLITTVLTPDGFYPLCPDSSQVGVVKIFFARPFLPEFRTYPVYNMVPRPGSPAQFGFNVDSGALHTPIMLTAHVRPGDFGVRVLAANTPQPLAIVGTSLTFWGVPADSTHDAERGQCLRNDGTSAGECPAGVPPVPFLANPSNCSAGRLTTTLRADSWQNPGAYDTASFDEDVDGNPMFVEDCAAVPFQPSVKVDTSARAADTPAGFDVSISLPQESNPVGLATGYLKRASIQFPEGVAVSASAARGLGACAPAEIGLGTDSPASCPEPSKLGSVRIETPLLEQPMQGWLYLAKQGDNPFGSLLATYLVAEGSGARVKLAGRVDTDPVTGRVTATFDDNPQLPFTKLDVNLFAGPGAALTTPRQCGTYETVARLSPWSAADPDSPTAAEVITSRSSFTVSENCAAAGRFTPGFEAGTTNPVGGKYSPFTLRVTREDGQQNLAAIDVTLPEGLLAKLAGVPLCGEAQAATGACPPASQVGTTTVGAGAGPSPVFVPEAGRAPTAAYLAGPYKGAPYSLVVTVPAQAGPFDLGTVTVRNALYVDPTTAQVSTKSDPLPQILQGIPIAYRDVRVDIDRRGFMLNPTSCNPMSIDGSIGSAQGAVAPVASRFQAADCGRLAFRPRLSLKLSGATARAGYPKLRAVLKARPGEANIDRVSVALPHSEFLAQEHIRTICTRVQFAADACPAKSVYGRARAITPLLDEPLEGPVYLRSSSNKLPDLVAALDGPIDIDLVGRIDSKDGGIRTTFARVPDAPVTKFVLEMQGGKKSLLHNSVNLCAGMHRAKAAVDGQNGKTADQRPVLASPCR
jgi:hypothetical protein